jgi:uncharacterized membrane protein YhaH (DUF805 family)
MEMDTNATPAIVEAGPRGDGLPKRTIAAARPVAWLVVVAADVGLLAWAAMAAFAPERLMGPGSAPILPAGYEGFTGASWEMLASVSPRTTEFATLLFRMYGLYGVAFSVLAIAVAATAFRRREPWAWWALLVGNTITYVGAMTYDQIVRAVGPFELTEYLGLALVYGFLAITAPFKVPGWKPTARTPRDVPAPGGE